MHLKEEIGRVIKQMMAPRSPMENLVQKSNLKQNKNTTNRIPERAQISTGICIKSFTL